MNLTQNPTIEELKKMVAQCNDDAHHIVWVSKEGEVNIEAFQPGRDDHFQWRRENEDNIQFRFSIIAACGGYFGPEAATDDRWMGELFNGVLTHWDKKSRGGIEVY